MTNRRKPFRFPPTPVIPPNLRRARRRADFLEATLAVVCYFVLLLAAGYLMTGCGGITAVPMADAGPSVGDAGPVQGDAPSAVGDAPSRVCLTWGESTYPDGEAFIYCAEWAQ